MKLLAGSREGFAFGEIGELTLKGLDEPVRTWRVGWAPVELTDQLGVPLPARVRAAADAALLGRHDEAEADFALALAINERMEAPFFIALTKVAWARMLADRGDAADADRVQKLAADAHTLAVEGGFGAIERQAATLSER